MTTRQYIGARYIPKFADPVEWDATKAYEYLTMVQHEGETYRSKQNVPVGAPLPDSGQGEENTEYWVHMSNWNAQIESYRQEVLQYNGRIETLENDLPTSSFDSVNTVAKAIGDLGDLLPASSFDSVNTVKAYIDSRYQTGDIRKYGAIEKSNDFDWDDVIADCAAESDTIYFPAGEWYIDKPLDLTGKNFVTVHGDMAKLTVIADNTIDAVMIYEAKKASDTPVAIATIDGFFFNCNGKATSAIKSMSANFNISNCKFMDYINYGINATANAFIYNLGKKIINCEFGDDAAQYQATQTAIAITTDSQVIGCKFFGQKVCIECTGSDIITGNLFYPGDDNTQRSIAIKATSGRNARELIITNNQFDSMPICIENIKTGQVMNNLFMWNSTIAASGAYTIFNRTRTIGGFYDDDMQGLLVFSNNEINNFAADDKIVHTFLNEVETLPILRYVSEYNTLHANTATQLENCRIAFGLDGFNYSSENPDQCLLFEPISNLPSTHLFSCTYTYTKQNSPFFNVCINDSSALNVGYIKEFNQDSNTTRYAKRQNNGKNFGIALNPRQLVKVESTFALIHEGKIVSKANYDSTTSSYLSDSYRYNCNAVS